MVQLSQKLKTYIESKGQDVSECLLYLFSCRFELNYKCSEETFQFLSENQFIKLNLMSNKIITLIGLFEDEEINLPDIDLSVQQIVAERIDEYRKLFKGIRTGSIGEKQQVIQLLTQFCLENNVTFDQVLETTELYMDYTERHLVSNADNFILKTDKNGNSISLLKIALEEQEMSGSSENRTWKTI